MAGWDNGVAVPGGASYLAPLLDFSPIGKLPSVYRQAGFDQQQKTLNDQQQQMNDVRIKQVQQQIELSKAFANGLPKDGQGNVDYRAAAGILASKGDIGGAVNLLQSAPPAPSPLLNGGGQGGASGAGQPGAAAPQAGGPPPASVQARPLPPSAPNSPQGDQGGSVIARVTDAMPGGSDKIGTVATNIARSVGVDPNAALTPDQAAAVDSRLNNYLKRNNLTPQGGAAPQTRVASAFAALPPSANAGTPAPPSAAAAQPQRAPAAPQGAPAPQGGPQAAPVPQGAPQAAPPQQGAPIGAGGQQPLTPQVPLPQGFTDPQKAILALDSAAAQYDAMPNGKGQATALRDYARRIEASIAPVKMGQLDTYVDPRTGKVIAEGPGAAALRATEHATGSPSLDADAERYRQSGTMPPGMGRGVQGAAEARAIRQRATELEIAAGGDTAAWPQKWQQFKGQQVALQRFTSGKQGDTIRSFNVLVDHLGTLDEAAAALKNGDTRAFNAIAQSWAANTGSTAPTNFDGVKALVGDEIVKAVVGSAGALADREEVKKDLDRASSPQQLAELVDHYKKLALGQLKGLRKQYEVSTRQKNFGDLLLPGTLSALGGGEGEGKKPAAEKPQGTTSSGVKWSVE